MRFLNRVLRRGGDGGASHETLSWFRMPGFCQGLGFTCWLIGLKPPACGFLYGRNPPAFFLSRHTFTHRRHLGNT